MEGKDTQKMYTETIGRRKTSIARIRISEAGKTSFTINDKDIQDFFPTRELQKIARDAITDSKVPHKLKVTVLVKGGGMTSQAEAIRHGIARALTALDPMVRKPLKELGYLKRDPRAKERRKFGLKKARKAPQWSKR